MSRWLRCSALLLGGLVVAGLLSAPAAMAGAAPEPIGGASGYDHQSPSHDWGGYTCADDARTVSQTNVVSRSSSAETGAVQVRYSPKCNTYWAQVFDHVGVTSQWQHYWFSAAIVGGDGTDIYCQFAEPDGFTGGGCYTAMLDRYNGRGYKAKGIMFHQTNQNIVAYGETPYVTGTGSAPARGTQIQQLALKNVGGTACGTNSLGSKGFYSSCTGNGGSPEYWCADFARWAWRNAGVTDVSGLSAAAASFYSYGKAHGTLSSTPSVGAAAVFSDSDSTGDIHHVAIVTAVNASAGTIETVSGDWAGDDGSQAHFASTSHVVHNVPAYKSALHTQSSTMHQYVVGYITPA